LTDHRAVPVETLREFARDRAELTSVRQVAAEAGLGRTTLRNFLTRGTTPHPRVRRLLALWYLGEKAKEQKPFLPEDYVSAFDILLDGLPDDHRARAAAALVEGLVAVHTGAGVEIPPALAELRKGDADPPS
jgi:AcrR family transcriptional regulator